MSCLPLRVIFSMLFSIDFLAHLGAPLDPQFHKKTIQISQNRSQVLQKTPKVLPKRRKRASRSESRRRPRFEIDLGTKNGGFFEVRMWFSCRNSLCFLKNHPFQKKLLFGTSQTSFLGAFWCQKAPEMHHKCPQGSIMLPQGGKAIENITFEISLNF